MKRFFRNFDWLSFAAMLALIAIGTVTIYSAGHARSALFHDVWIRNLVTASVGIVLYFLLAAFDYRRYLAVVALPAYALSLVCLALVLAFGSEVLGGRRWLWFFQPSEVAKLSVLVLLSVLFGSETLAELRKKTVWFRGFRGFSVATLIVGVPVVFILAEPDLGTALTLVPAAAVVIFAAGAWRRGLVTIVAIGGMAALAVLGAVYEAEKPTSTDERRQRIMRYVPLKPHQVKRVKTFLFPDSDPLKSGHNLRQSKIAIGSGGMVGKGIGNGEQNHLKYLPPAVSMNDFIFCVYAEETGYRGSLLLLSLFAVLLMSGCLAASRASDGSGRFFALGVTTLVLAHVYINIGMSIGLVPITGLPLPFISSGRTFLMMVIVGFGIVQSVSVHRNG